MDDSLQALIAQSRAAAEAADFKRAVLRCCDGIDVEPCVDRFSTAIDPRDQMFTHSLREHRDAGAALCQYFNIGAQQYNAARQIITALFGDARDIAILDFACGYGRLLRFLTLQHDRERITAAELQADALAFVVETFAVDTIRSTPDPADFKPAQRFDCIWVASLFSHLPERLFNAWLAKLHALLTPRGVLVFSVRSAELAGSEKVLSAAGFRYEPASENADLAADIYGTAYASETYVAAAIRVAVDDANVGYRRLPRALANEQDIYVVSKSERDLSALDGFTRGAWGWVDRRQIQADGSLELEGWAGSLDADRETFVEIIVNGRTQRVATGIERHDVSAAFDAPWLARSGWRFVVDGPSATTAFDIDVYARTSRSNALLYRGAIAR